MAKPEMQPKPAAKQTAFDAVPLKPVQGGAPAAPAGEAAESALHSLIFDAGAEESAPIHPTAKAVVAAATTLGAQLWPANVPLLEQVEQVLTGGLDAAGELHATTKAFLGGCSEVEMAALWGNPLPFDSAGLKRAVLTRWRLAAALALKPAGATAFDSPSMDKLLAEVDEALAALPTAEVVGEDHKEAIGNVRGALARDAVALAEVAQQMSQTVAQTAVTTTRKKYEHVATRMVAMSTTSEPSTDRRTKVMVGVVIFLALLSAVFNGSRMMPKAVTEPPRPASAPVGTIGIEDPTTGIAMFTPTHGKIGQADLDRVEAQARAAGKTFMRIGPEQYAIIPAGMKNPFTEFTDEKMKMLPQAPR